MKRGVKREYNRKELGKEKKKVTRGKKKGKEGAKIIKMFGNLAENRTNRVIFNKDLTKVSQVLHFLP